MSALRISFWIQLIFLIVLPSQVQAESDSWLKSLDSLGFTSDAVALLPADQAFGVSAEMADDQKVRLKFEVAKGYYLYRDKIKVEAKGPKGLSLGSLVLPEGEAKNDPEFGLVQVFHHPFVASLTVNLERQRVPQPFSLEISFQGCADRGVCYPPMKSIQRVDPSVIVPESSPAPAPSFAISEGSRSNECVVGPPRGFVEENPISEQCGIVERLQRESLWVTALSFLGMGLLLAFTPCIFPMIPILSGLIVGHGADLSTRKAFGVSLSYVIASAITYTFMGVVAGLFGSNLQAFFQNAWVIAAFSSVFILLALSMFGFYALQLPAFLQTRLSLWSQAQHQGSYVGAALMGALSTLIVGPCVAAPLAGALIYIGQTGDALLGGVALFFLGLGMGLPLLVLGASAGRWLPKAGEWMNSVKAVFGFLLLGVAIWLLSRVIVGPLFLLLVSLYAIIMGVTLASVGTVEGKGLSVRVMQRSLAVLCLFVGLVEFLGAALGLDDPLVPLRFEVSGQVPSETLNSGKTLSFEKVSSKRELELKLKALSVSGRSGVVEFYADWCVSCKELERFTFSDPEVMAILKPMVRLRVDVTQNTDEQQSILREFGLIGPPAVLFFSSDGREINGSRLIGYVEASDFVRHVNERVRP